MSNELEVKSIEEWHAALKQAVAARGEGYRYQDEFGTPDSTGCRYVVAGKPACIVGQAYYNLYGTLPQKDDEGMAAQYVVPGGTVDVPQGYIVSPLGEALSEAQGAQDDGYPWGAALAAFEAQAGIK